ncbi:hypothetical protein HPB51_018615 [Rhipicephalus microplus]|uniref:Uncharacterized protein n=1 Tax=Rhipicephalus microplus TaxID=6941 RepID=A0A9J6F7N7_RHIMP|nr:hypothetical protein HPB51_018615 [Rhipicephalus microplus]
MIMRDAVVEGSGNFDHLGFFNVHPNLSTRAYNISASIGNAAAAAGIKRSTAKRTARDISTTVLRQQIKRKVAQSAGTTKVSRINHLFMRQLRESQWKVEESTRGLPGQCARWSVRGEAEWRQFTSVMVGVRLECLAKGKSRSGKLHLTSNLVGPRCQQEATAAIRSAVGR